MAFKHHWPLPAKHTATTAGNTTQVVTNIKYRQPKDEEEMHEHGFDNLHQDVWCHREMNRAAMWMHRSEFSRQVELKSNRWRKQVVLHPDPRLSSSISSLMEHCLHFEPTPGGAADVSHVQAGNAYLQVRQIRGRKLHPQPPTPIPASSPLPPSHRAEPLAPLFLHCT